MLRVVFSDIFTINDRTSASSVIHGFGTALSLAYLPAYHPTANQPPPKTNDLSL
jgi:hypothetical protein